MSTKKVKTRIIQKHDTSANWAQASNFYPEKGEIIIYDDVKDAAGAPKIKIGDGSTKVSNLPFASEVTLSNLGITATASEINILDGIDVTTTDLNNIKTAFANIAALEARNAFSEIKVGTTSITADAAADTLTLAAGTNIKLTPDANNDKVTIEATLPYRLAGAQASTTGYLTNPNNGLETGFYYVKGATNRPNFSQNTNDDYRILVTAYGNNWLQQIATDFRCDDIFYRRLENNTWKSWVKIYPSANLTVGSKTYNGTSPVTLSASDLGLAAAMKFLGTSTTAITDGATTNKITIGSTSTTVTAGNVVLYGGYEYVWTGAAWEQLGQEGSFSLIDHTHGNITKDGKLATSSAVVITDDNKNITTSTDITTTELNHLSGISDNIQNQLNKKVTTDTVQTITGTKTFNAPTNIDKTEQTTTKFKTSNGGAIIFGKEGPNSGTMIRLDQADGTARLRFRASSTAGAMVWEQPEKGAQLYVDLGKEGDDKHRITFPSAAGTLALKSEIPTTPSAIGAAASSHGNHVPTTETANNAKFLRNDNTWQTVTPANIGAAASSHSQAADTITAGTFGGQVVAKSDSQALNTSLLRNSRIVSISNKNNSSYKPTVTGEIVWYYE